MGELSGRVALVTGAASGIGRAIAETLAEAGADVAIADIDIAGAESAAAGVRAKGVRSLVVKADVGSADEVRAMVASTLAAFGSVDVLVNNAANLRLLIHDRDLLDSTPDTWDATYRVIQQAAMLATQLVLPGMLEKGRGSIVNITSVDGESGDTTKIAYGMGKAAVNLLTLCVATAYGPRGVRCNAIAPGLIMTPPAIAGVRVADRPIWSGNIRSPRLGIPEDVAAMVRFLVSDGAAYVNGQVIRVDGGLLSHVPHLAQFEAAARGTPG